MQDSRWKARCWFAATIWPAPTMSRERRRHRSFSIGAFPIPMRILCGERLLRSTDRSRALMLQGTGSNVGKSLLTAGLCRALTQRGLAVRPFKPQNMSNNAAVTTDGGEIGRAQALQARACGVAPVSDMNPVLLKPQTDVGAQVVVHGKIFGAAKAGDYQRLRPTLLPAVLDSFYRLVSTADIVLVE